MYSCRLALLLLAAPLVWVSIGCSKIAEKIQEKVVDKAIEARSGGAVKVDRSSGEMTVRTKNGTQSVELGGGAKLPAAFPKQVPIYPGGKIVASVADTAKKPRFTVAFQTPDTTDKVIAFYKEQLKTFKLELEQREEGRGALLFVDRTQSKLKVTVQISQGGDHDGNDVGLVVEGT